jgi:hypothetical protein
MTLMQRVNADKNNKYKIKTVRAVAGKNYE